MPQKMPRKVSRRTFTRGALVAGGLMLVSRRTSAADFELRQFHNQLVIKPHKPYVTLHMDRD